MCWEYHWCLRFAYCHHVHKNHICGKQARDRQQLRGISARATRSAHDATHEVVWLRQFLEVIGFPQSEPTTIHCDNNTATSMILSEDQANHSKVKHIDVQYHYLRECIQRGLLQLVHVSSASNTADILTTRLFYFRNWKVRYAIYFIS